MLKQIPSTGTVRNVWKTGKGICMLASDQEGVKKKS